jgi:Domain of unknown function (DUF4159)
MKLLPRLLLVLPFLGLSGIAFALQRTGFRDFPQDTGGPPNETAEFSFARLRYPTGGGFSGGFGDFGFRRGGWQEDYPKADRQFVEGVVRLTRINARSYQEVVDPDGSDADCSLNSGNECIFNWPWIYAVNVADWDFNEAQAKRMRDYLNRGGFLVVDSFHGEVEWEGFLRGMRKILPDRPIEDLADKDEIFHVLYDLGERFQVPGYQYIGTGRTYERDGIVPKWRAIRDDNGRIMVMIGHNMHIGDAWEHADDPRYPERFSSLAYRLGINYIIYGMTH